MRCEACPVQSRTRAVVLGPSRMIVSRALYSSTRDFIAKLARLSRRAFDAYSSGCSSQEAKKNRFET